MAEMREFGCTQCISLPPQELDKLHDIELWGRLKEDLSMFHKKYIEIWQRRYTRYTPAITPPLGL
ncbi:hypothetical protein J1N35_028149 [Gossypium stocksii]|uniref:Uncharacterized protein n=1 Tax=Gossypium stocksii TaxID=47602 RepID=A0A9D3UVQ2_9ROSI|nr:hypothetical protein J1N35_028149 [Gossypium stocksii]